MGMCLRKDKSEDAGRHRPEPSKPKSPSGSPPSVDNGKPRKANPSLDDNAPGVQAKITKDAPKGFSRKKLEKLFAKYKDESGDNAHDTPVMGPEGIEKFCHDLDISPEDVLVLVVAYNLNAQEMGYFTQKEFLEGFEKLGLDSIEGIRAYLPKFEAQLEDQNTFKAIYRFAFFFAKEDSDKKVVDMEMAAGMLALVMGGRVPIAKSFVEFLKVQESYKALNLDQWMSFYEFCKVVGNDLSSYDENSAWPCIIDEWVEWRKTEGTKEAD